MTNASTKQPDLLSGTVGLAAGDAALNLMNNEHAPSILIAEQGHLVGPITDRDLRNRVIAAGLDTQLPIVVRLQRS